MLEDDYADFESLDNVEKSYYVLCSELWESKFDGLLQGRRSRSGSRCTNIKNPGATHGKWTSRKLCNTLLGYIKKQQFVEFMLLHSKNALEMISEYPNIQNFLGLC